MDRKEFEKRLEEWKEKVMGAYKGKEYYGHCAVNTYAMIIDIDRLIAEAFEHDTVLEYID